MRNLIFFVVVVEVGSVLIKGLLENQRPPESALLILSLEAQERFVRNTL